jgi:GAF domain-containing protein
MSLPDRFDAAVTAEAAAFPELELLPVRLARACVQVLPVSGAGISALAHPDLRLPIGASDDVAGYVERLQFTYGEGPCLHAYATGRPQLISAIELQEHWPELHREFTTITPFRAVASLPLFDQATRIGALDLYLTAPAGLDPAGLEDALVIAQCVSRALSAARAYTAAAQHADPFGPPHDGFTAPMAERVQVWKAMGLMNVHLQLTTPDALALLRAHAYATDSLVDDLAHAIVTRRIPLDHLRP